MCDKSSVNKTLSSTVLSAFQHKLQDYTFKLATELSPITNALQYAKFND